VPVIGAFHVVEPLPEAEVGLPAISRAPYGPPEKCHGHLPLSQAGLVAGEWRGAGRIVVMPWTVGRGYREVGLSAHRDLFVDALVRLAGVFTFDDSASGIAPLPASLEVVSSYSNAGQILHLINRSGDADQRFRQPVTIRGVSLVLDSGVTGVSALRAGVDLPLSSHKGMTVVQLPDIDLFEVLVLAERPNVVREVVDEIPDN
jgi:hypothetical protein